MVPEDSNYAERVRASFDRQRAMTFLGAQLRLVEPGRTEIALLYRQELTQQHGFIHAGIVTAIADSACGYAALSLMPLGVGVLTIEFKVNLLNPASGARLVARGQVVKPGRTLMVCTADVTAEQEDGASRAVALIQATIMVVRDRPGVTD
jgi:uncharacterized protein (TIGR00369 family)